jgi:hypothetical protein
MVSLFYTSILNALYLKKIYRDDYYEIKRFKAKYGKKVRWNAETEGGKNI